MMKKIWLLMSGLCLVAMNVNAMNKFEDDTNPVVACAEERLARGQTGAQLDEKMQVTEYIKSAPLSKLVYDAKNIKLVERLLKAGANPSVKRGEPLKNALYLGGDCMVELLLQYGAKLNYEPSNKVDQPLNFCMGFSKLNVILQLLEYGARINARDKYGCIALHSALIHCHDMNQLIPKVKLLLRYGADPQIKVSSRMSGYNGQNSIGIARFKAIEKEFWACDILYVKLANYLEIAPDLRRNALYSLMPYLQKVAEEKCGKFLPKELAHMIISWVLVAEDRAPFPLYA